MDFTPLRHFMDRMTAEQIPGNSCIVTLGGKEVFRHCSGYADVASERPMDGTERINIYSCAKVATVVGALKLLEQGQILLDDPLYDYIPEYRDMVIKNEKGEPFRAKHPITLRHLFTMTSGLSYDVDTPAFQKARDLTTGRMETLTVIKCLASDPLSFDPGARWQYSLSHDVLAAVVEVVTGRKFRDYMQDEVFAPLGMTETVYHNDDIHDQMATLYRRLDAPGPDGKRFCPTTKRVRYIFGPEYDSGGAGITTTASDFSKFTAALASGGTGLNGERILSPCTVSLMVMNQLTPAQLKSYNWTTLRGCGYGLGVRTVMDRAQSSTLANVGAFGWGGAAGADLLIDPSIGLSVFYGQHLLDPQGNDLFSRLQNVVYACLGL